MKIKFIFFLLGMLFLQTISYAQEIDAAELNKRIIEGDTLPELIVEKDTIEDPSKKKRKKKRNVFYGFKTRKGFTRTGEGEKEVTELFYVLRKSIELNSVLDEYYIWDLDKSIVVRVRKEDLTKIPNYMVLHGPYNKFEGGKNTEIGIFYLGQKHGRWEKYNREFILIGKARYNKGFLRESKISYYDAEQKKIKEVIPFEFGQKTGTYYYFNESGKILIRGNYADGKKVGLWVEYHEKTLKKKRETKYPKDQYDKSAPEVLKEWDEKGKLILQNGDKVDNNSNNPLKKALGK